MDQYPPNGTDLEASGYLFDRGVSVSPTISILEIAGPDGHTTKVGYNFKVLFKELAMHGDADVAIVSTEEGFSPLGASREFFERDLRISYDEVIRPLAHWNMTANTNVSLVALQSRNTSGKLKGIILAPGNNTASYRPFQRTPYDRPSRDFYYNVSYEAFSYAFKYWGAKKIAISHLSGSGEFHRDIATCHVEALAHLCEAEANSAPESLIFCGCCIEVDHLSGISQLQARRNNTRHRPIRVEEERREGTAVLHLSWD